MMENFKTQLSNMQSELQKNIEHLNLKDKIKQLQDLEQQTVQIDFWQQDHQKTQSIIYEINKLKEVVGPWLKLQKNLLDLRTLSLDIQTKDDRDLMELKRLLKEYGDDFLNLKKQLRFQGTYDNYDVILSIFAGAGGVDAQDWAKMLWRMYERWAQAHQLTIQLIHQSAGEEAGLKSLSVSLKGKPFLYGWLKGEHGVHRLVRLSPFNALNLRQTSFAKVEVIPALKEATEVDLVDNDLRFDYYKSSGHGGQSVNTTDSAVRVTHLPTKITVSIQNERSQKQNKDLALSILRSKLLHLKIEQQAQTIADLKGRNVANEWGSQIRNYVLHPYKQIKDLRTQHVTTEVSKVLDGDLDEFLTAYLDYFLTS